LTRRTAILAAYAKELASEKGFLVDAAVMKLLKDYWGYDSLRPLQAETMGSVMSGRDSLTVMPTGGGKSLCFQLPALMSEGMAIVISPTISLMKDQVDGLRTMGIAAAFWNSSLSAEETREVNARVREGSVKLLYITPERLVMSGMIQLFKELKPAFFVIDEAHCISEWGHSFRADYFRLSMIKQEFPASGVHAFTASATSEVQKDIVLRLGLSKPALHIGHVDRPNLTYRMRPRTNLLPQLEQILSRHPEEPGIIYCAKRKDVDRVSEHLNEKGFKNLPYHAGLTDSQRSENQNRFASEEIDLMVATLAFGMGIDRSNIRFVIHAAMPRNMEQYYQETGRAGRDGLPSSCYLLFGAEDYRTGMFFIGQESNRDVLVKKLNRMYGICLGPQCRHRVLTEYFDQVYERENCGSCDYCLGELEFAEDAATLARKILSAVARCSKSGLGFGGGHIADVLRGQVTDKVTKFKHDELSVFGLLPEESAASLRYMIEQLAGQGFLVRDGEYGTLGLTDKGRMLLKEESAVILAKPVSLKKEKVTKQKKALYDQTLSDEEQILFDRLRAKRSQIARQKNKPAYIIFSDKTLLDMAVKKPVTMGELLDVFGVGAEKQNAYGPEFVAVIAKFIAGTE